MLLLQAQALRLPALNAHVNTTDGFILTLEFVMTRLLPARGATPWLLPLSIKEDCDLKRHGVV